jgi:hypothetical protein
MLTGESFVGEGAAPAPPAAPDVQLAAR